MFHSNYAASALLLLLLLLLLSTFVQVANFQCLLHVAYGFLSKIFSHCFSETFYRPDALSVTNQHFKVLQVVVTTSFRYSESQKTEL